jgi:phosphonopyruvate decarboxylase
VIKPQEFYSLLKQHDISFFSGVPDSLLKHFCAYVTDNTDADRHIIAANEGNAVALAAGYHLATGKIGCVYMQNSGQGNAANPLISLTDPDVYSIPLLLLIGWRGTPGIHDEPQHVKQGKITKAFLDTLGIPSSLLKEEDLGSIIESAVYYMKNKQAPYGIIVPKGIFDSYELKTKETSDYPLTREQAIKLIVDKLHKEDIIVSTTGKTSRELFEYREELKQGHKRDFLTVGSMGHSSSIALGIALRKGDRSVYCLDGDGALIMHMGSMGIIGSSSAANFKHIVLNNGSHESVGGQPTVGFKIDIPALARACGYETTITASTESEVKDSFSILKVATGPALLEIKVKKGARSDLGRPTTTPQQNKKNFMEFVGS